MTLLILQQTTFENILVEGRNKSVMRSLFSSPCLFTCFCTEWASVQGDNPIIHRGYLFPVNPLPDMPISGSSN